MATDRTVLVRLKANVGDFVAGMTTARAAVRGLTSEIDTTNDRVAWLTQGILGIGPAAIPVAAAAIPMLTGIATQAVVATGAISTMALAFVGVGDALKAVNDYQLDPTLANLEQMQQALENLGPAGAEFVAFLDSLGPQLRELQELSREGIFPGAEEGLTALVSMMPRAKNLVADLADALGDLMARGGQDLAGPEWAEFFEFLDRNAAPVLTEMGDTIGNFAQGFANMLVAFEPLSLRFTGGLLEVSEAFAGFDFDESTGFQGFLRYIEDALPRALDFLGSLALTFASIIEAAAPVGDILLPIFTVFLDIVGELMETPLGPMFIAAAAAMSLYGRAVALASVSTGGLGASLGRLAVANLGFNASLKSSIPTMAQWSAYGARMGQSAEMASKKTHAARAAVYGFGRSIAPAAGALAGMGLLMTGTADKMGAQNTVMLALTGAMIGGAPGAVAGGLVGATLDLAAANGKAADAQRALSADLRAAGADLNKNADALQAAKDRANEFAADVHSAGFGEFAANLFDPDAILNNLKVLANETSAGFSDINFETVGDQMDDMASKAEARFGDLKLVGQLLAEQLGIVGDTGVASFDQMNQAITQMQPAMSALDITVEDLVEGVRTGGIMDLIDQMAAWTQHADSDAGRIDAVAAALAGLDGEFIQTAESAKALNAAMDALLDPKMNLAEAWDAWRDGLRNLSDELAKNRKNLFANTDAASQNRQVIRDRVNDLRRVLATEAEAGASAGQLTRTMRQQRQALLDAGDAANLSESQLRKYLRQLGFTPKLVSTLIEANTTQAERNVAHLQRLMNNLKSKTVYITMVGIRKGPGGQDSGYSPSAEGNLFPTVQSYARGDVADRHQPELAGPGPTRVWREPETQGEAYIPLANDDRRPRARSILEMTASLLGGDVQWFADGGVVPRGRGGSGSGAFWVEDVNVAMLLLSEGLRGLQRELKKSEKILAAETSQRDAVRDKMQQLASGVAGGLRSDIFAAPANPWAAGGTGATGALERDISTGEEWIRLVEQVSGKGLKGAALAELLSRHDIALLRSYAAMPADVLAHYSRLYERREQVLTAAGVASGQAAHGAEERLAIKELQEIQQEVRDLRRAVEHADRNNTKGQTDNAEQISKGFSDSAGNARRNARRPR